MGNLKIARGLRKENVLTSNRFYSRSQIEIHTASATYGPHQSIDPSKNLMNWTYQKQLSSDNASNEIGTATITLTAGVTGLGATSTWMDLVHIQDLVMIYVSPYRNSQMRTRFIGVITDISYQTDTNSDPENPTRNIQIQAEDLIMGLQSQILFPVFAPTFINGTDTALQQLFTHLQQIVSTYGTTVNQNGLPLLNVFGALLQNSTSMSAFTALSPSRVAQIVVNQLAPILFTPTFYMRNRHHGGSTTWVQLITQAYADTTQFAGANYYVTPQEETLQSMLSSIMNPPFLEFFGDVRSADQLGGIPSVSNNGAMFGPDNAQYYLVVRNTPFDTSSGLQGTSSTAFEELPITDVYLKNTSANQWYYTNSDVVNYYFVYPESFMQMSGFQATVQMLYQALVDVDSVTKYGLQPMQIAVLGFPDFNTLFTSTAATTSIQQTLAQFNQTLYDWYKDNPSYLRGTVTIHGDPSIRVGQRIRIRSIGLVAYVEAVQENFVTYESYQAVVTFSRGVFETGYPGP